MGLTGFNRARREAEERSKRETEEAVLEQPGLEGEDKSATVADLNPSTVDRDSRIAELQAGNWEALRDLLKQHNLPTAKPKGVSWDEWAIPQILKAEGL